MEWDGQFILGLSPLSSSWKALQEARIWVQNLGHLLKPASLRRRYIMRSDESDTCSHRAHLCSAEESVLGLWYLHRYDQGLAGLEIHRLQFIHLLNLIDGLAGINSGFDLPGNGP